MWWWNKDVNVCRKRELFKIWKKNQNEKGKNIVRQEKMLRE